MADEPKAYKAKLKDFKADPRNLNQHTQRGRGMVEASQRKRGYARPAFAAKDGTVLGGNLSTMEVAPDIGLGDGEVFVVETDGKIPIIHKRVDVEAGSEEALLLAAEDNKTTEVSLDWDAEALIQEVENGLDLSSIFFDDELAEFEEEARLTSELSESLLEDTGISSFRNLGDKKKQVKPVLYVDEVAIFENAIKATGLVNRGQALLQICRHYLEER